MKIEKFVFAALIDIAIAVEHLCLAATEQGLATCWVYNFDANLLSLGLHTLVIFLRLCK